MLRVKRKLTDEEGLTLVELLAAIMILSIIVISFLGVYRDLRDEKRSYLMVGSFFFAFDLLDCGC